MGRAFYAICCVLLIFAISDPAYAVDLTGKTNLLAPADLTTLREILDSAKVTSAEVTDGPRSAKSQAQAMYNYAKKEGKKEAIALYCAVGDQALAEFDEKKPEAEVVSAMEKIVNENSAKARELGCLNHITNEVVYAIDVGLNSVKPESVREALGKAMDNAKSKGKIARGLHFWSTPQDKTAFHFEFKLK
jgi:hypothetical protein